MHISPVSILRTLAALYLLGILGGCGDSGERLKSTEPQPLGPQTHSLTGRVRLTGRLTDGIDTDQGLRRVDDADSVLVRLRGPGGLTDSVVTTAGIYTFHHLAPGTYSVRTCIVPETADSISGITVSGRDTTVTDTLALESRGEIHSYPNPGAPEGIGTEFTTHSAQTYELEVRTLRGDVIWSYGQAVYPGYYHVHWDGDGRGDNPAEPGTYWIVALVDGVHLYNLVFWPGSGTAPAPGNCGHILAYGLFLEEAGARVVNDWLGHQSGGLEVPSGAAGPVIHLEFLASDSTAFAVADTCPENHLSWTLDDSTVAKVSLEPGTKWWFRLHGLRTGATNLMLHAWHQDHIHINSQPIPVVVR